MYKPKFRQKTKFVGARVTEGEREALLTAAQERGLTVSEFTREALRAYVGNGREARRD